jgi:hypothetical protein
LVIPGGRKKRGKPNIQNRTTSTKSAVECDENMKKSFCAKESTTTRHDTPGAIEGYLRKSTK